MNPKAIDQPNPHGTDADKDPTVSPEEERVIRERLATFERDRKTASPAGEAIERLLRRHPAP
jgi:hypothetical protein